MENWEFLLQRKGDKSWLPLESPNVEILEGQYRLAARSDLANVSVGIAIAYRPLADVRHQPLQQKIVKRLSHDGLLIVMPYTSFVPGLWQIDCLSVVADLQTDIESESESQNANTSPPWKRTVKFDVIPISSDFGSEWQYSDSEEDVEPYSEIPTELHTNALGIEQTEPTSLRYSSPILDIAEQRSTELVQSMFEEFALFNDEIENENDDEEDNQRELTSDRLSLSELVSPEPLSSAEKSNEQDDEQSESALQPRILLRLQQPQYIVNEDNSFNLVGDAYTKGEIEVSLKDPQTLEVVLNERYPIVRLGDRNNLTGAIPFAYQINVPPPSQIQVLIGEVQIHPQKDFQQYGDLFVTQQAIAVSYPASRVLPEMLKEAQKYEILDSSEADDLYSEEAIASSSYPQSPQSFPQASQVTENVVTEPAPKPKVVHALSLPPLPSNKPKSPEAATEEVQQQIFAVSLPPLPPLKKRTIEPPVNLENSLISEDYAQGFPQVEVDELQKIEAEFALTDLLESNGDNAIPSSNLANEDEPEELFYSFEEELPNNYEELLEQQKLETLRGQPLPSFNGVTKDASGRSNRFLNKLQTLSAEAIATQKASQRNEELLLDNFVPSDSLGVAEDLSGLSIDVDHPEQPLTIAEENSLAELDRELDLELDRLLAPNLPDLILNEYVWEDPIDPNSFPVSGLTGLNRNTSASALSETAQTIRNIQDSSPQALSEQEPVPIPDLIVPLGEIVSGTPMMVTVRLPAIASKFFVKFWIKDLQTRTIIDGPRWLLDFSVVPNTELMETRTNISIPLSSIDVAFEAIAIEAQTQRESHKVRVTRAVTPPNLVQDINYE